MSPKKAPLHLAYFFHKLFSGVIKMAEVGEMYRIDKGDEKVFFDVLKEAVGNEEYEDEEGSFWGGTNTADRMESEYKRICEDYDIWGLWKDYRNKKGIFDKKYGDRLNRIIELYDD